MTVSFITMCRFEFTIVATLWYGCREALHLGITLSDSTDVSWGKIAIPFPTPELPDGKLELFAPLMPHLHSHIFYFFIFLLALHRPMRLLVSAKCCTPRFALQKKHQS